MVCRPCTHVISVKSAKCFRTTCFLTSSASSLARISAIVNYRLINVFLILFERSMWVLIVWCVAYYVLRMWGVESTELVRAFYSQVAIPDDWYVRNRLFTSFLSLSHEPPRFRVLSCSNPLWKVIFEHSCWDQRSPPDLSELGNSVAHEHLFYNFYKRQ